MQLPSCKVRASTNNSNTGICFDNASVRTATMAILYMSKTAHGSSQFFMLLSGHFDQESVSSLALSLSLLLSSPALYGISLASVISFSMVPNRGPETLTRNRMRLSSTNHWTPGRGRKISHAFCSGLLLGRQVTGFWSRESPTSLNQGRYPNSEH